MNKEVKTYALDICSIDILLEIKGLNGEDIYTKDELEKILKKNKIQNINEFIEDNFIECDFLIDDADISEVKVI